MNRSDVVEKAREYIGTPFHHQGRVKGVGVDCIGLITGVAHELGLFTHDRTDYSRTPDGKTMLLELGKVLKPINVDDVQPGDMYIFWMSSCSKFPQHVGILTDHGIIHTYGDVEKVVEQSLDDFWKERIHSAYKYPGVD